MNRKISPDALAAGIGLLVLAAVSLLHASAVSARMSFPSTYDTGRNGYAALYEFLARERIGVRRFEAPLGELPGPGVALVVAGDGALNAISGSSNALENLDAWVKSGNTLYLFGSIGDRARRTLGVPALIAAGGRESIATFACGIAREPVRSIVDGDFSAGFRRGCTPRRAALLRTRNVAPAIAIRRGRGTLVAIVTPTVFDNWDLPRHDNARFAFALFAGAAAVAFDERPYGYAAGRTFWQVLAWPVRVAIGIAALALLLALIGANLPFAPPYSAPPAPGRDSGAYIASLAQLLLRARAAREIVRRLSSQSETLLRTRSRNDPRSADLLKRARAMAALAQPGPGDVLAAGELFAAVRKDYE